MSMQRKSAPPQKVSDAVKVGEAVELRTNSAGLKILTRVKKDEKLEKIAGTVFDQMQKIIDEVNVGYNYIQKTKILTAQLEYYTHLRPYENIIRKATHLTVDSDPTSLDQLRDRLCTDPFLGLFFDHVNLCRRDEEKKKMTTNDWLILKQTIIAYYFNFFLHKKYKYVIKKSKLPTFASSCILMKPDTNRFKDLFVFELNNGSLGKVGTSGKAATYEEDDLFLSSDYVEQMETFKDEFRNAQYDTIKELLDAANEIWRDDPDNANIISNLQRFGVKQLRSAWSSIVATSNSDKNTAKEIGGKDILYGVGGGVGGLMIGGAVASLGLLSAPFSIPIVAAIGGIGSSVYRYFTRDGAIVSNVSKLTSAAPSASEISVGKISYDGNKWIQKGFFITLCYFIDELLEECRAEFEKTYGAIVWGFVEPIGEKKIIDFSQIQQNLREIVALLPASAATTAGSLYTQIQNLKTDNVDVDVKAIRDKLDDALMIEIEKVIDASSGDLKSTNDATLQTDRVAVRKYWAALSNDAKTDSTNKHNKASKIFEATIADIDTWKWNGSASVRKDGECGYSAPKKDSRGRNYRKSPLFRAMKKDLKEGSISKEEYKKGKKELKSILG
jgi:hypothetical protein